MNTKVGSGLCSYLIRQSRRLVVSSSRRLVVSSSRRLVRRLEGRRGVGSGRGRIAKARQPAVQRAVLQCA